MKGILGVFLEEANDEDDFISLNKLKNRRHNVTWKRRCWVFNLIVSKRLSVLQPINVRPYFSRYPSGFEVQIRGNNGMELASSP